MEGKNSYLTDNDFVDFDERHPSRSKLVYDLSQASVNLLAGIALESSITFNYNIIPLQRIKSA